MITHKGSGKNGSSGMGPVLQPQPKSEKPESQPDGDTDLPDRDKLRSLVVKGEEFTGLTQVNHLNGFPALFASNITRETHSLGKRQSLQKKVFYEHNNS